MPWAARRSEPAQITSSDFRIRSDRPCSPSDHRSASARLLLPDPLGPTTALIPGPNSTTVRSAKDLKPWRRRARRRAGALTAKPPFAAVATSSARRLARGLVAKHLDGALGGRRLGDAPRRPLPDPERTAVDHDLDLEQLLVIGTGRIDDVVLGPRAGLPLGELLETALRAL